METVRETAVLGAGAVRFHRRQLALGNVGTWSWGSEDMMRWVSCRWKGWTGAKGVKSGMRLAVQGMQAMKGAVC